MATIVIRLTKRFVSLCRCRCGEKTALRLFLSMPDHFAGHCAAIEAGQFFSTAAVLGCVRADNVAPPSAL